MAEMMYYGTLSGGTTSTWLIIQRIIIPIIIFFRFHSLVVLVECWKNSYRSEEEPRYETTKKAGANRRRTGTFSVWRRENLSS